MWFLRRRNTEDARAWWTAVAQYPHGAPGVVREPLSSASVVCDQVEAEQAMAWARTHPAWRQDEPALEVVDTLIERRGPLVR